MKKLGPVLLAVVLDLLGFGLVIPLLPYIAESSGATAQQAMALMGVYSVAQFVFAPMWGSMSDSRGRRPIMLFSIAGTALFLAIFAWASTEHFAALFGAGAVLPVLFATRLLHGACAANISTAQAYVADVTTREDRAKGMGLIGASFGLGFTLGPWLGGELARFGLATPIFLAAALSAINFVWALRGLPESRVVGERGKAGIDINPVHVFRTIAHPVVGSALLLVFLATFAFSLMEISFGLVAEHVWYPDLTRKEVAMTIGRVFGLIGVIGVFIQGGLIGRLSKRFGDRSLVIFGYVVNAIGLWMLLGVTRGGTALLVAASVISVGNAIASPSLRAMISKGVDEDSQGKVMGVNQSLGAFARATAPWVAAVLYGYGPSVPFAVAGSVMLGGLALAGIVGAATGRSAAEA